MAPDLLFIYLFIIYFFGGELGLSADPCVRDCRRTDRRGTGTIDSGLNDAFGREGEMCW